MRWWLVLLGALIAVVALTFGIQIANLRGELGQARAEVATQQRAGVRFEGELAAERAAFAQAEARIGGTHRDLITCSDWQGMFLPVQGTDSFNGQLSASAGPPSLPQHCINQ